jgi:hypothetical protein
MSVPDEGYSTNMSFTHYISYLRSYFYYTMSLPVTFIRYVSGITFIRYVSGITFIRYAHITIKIETKIYNGV